MENRKTDGVSDDDRHYKDLVTALLSDAGSESKPLNDVQKMNAGHCLTLTNSHQAEPTNNFHTKAQNEIPRHLRQREEEGKVSRFRACQAHLALNEIEQLLEDPQFKDQRISTLPTLQTGPILSGSVQNSSSFYGSAIEEDNLDKMHTATFRSQNPAYSGTHVPVTASYLPSASISYQAPQYPSEFSFEESTKALNLCGIRHNTRDEILSSLSKQFPAQQNVTIIKSENIAVKQEPEPMIQGGIFFRQKSAPTKSVSDFLANTQHEVSESSERHQSLRTSRTFKQQTGEENLDPTLHRAVREVTAWSVDSTQSMQKLNSTFHKTKPLGLDKSIGISSKNTSRPNRHSLGSQFFISSKDNVQQFLDIEVLRIRMLSRLEEHSLDGIVPGQVLDLISRAAQARFSYILENVKENAKVRTDGVRESITSPSHLTEVREHLESIRNDEERQLAKENKAGSARTQSSVLNPSRTTSVRTEKDNIRRKKTKKERVALEKKKVADRNQRRALDFSVSNLKTMKKRKKSNLEKLILTKRYKAANNAVTEDVPSCDDETRSLTQESSINLEDCIAFCSREPNMRQSELVFKYLAR